jgi:exopolysaccharide biosynthesis protein
VVADGRRAGSVGLTLGELQRYMARLGTHAAINLDGGGSSTMVLHGTVRNQPSDGRERAIAGIVETGWRRPACANAFVRCN